MTRDEALKLTVAEILEMTAPEWKAFCDLIRQDEGYSAVLDHLVGVWHETNEHTYCHLQHLLRMDDEQYTKYLHGETPEMD